jgi:hypothetical protein
MGYQPAYVGDARGTAPHTCCIQVTLPFSHLFKDGDHSSLLPHDKALGVDDDRVDREGVVAGEDRLDISAILQKDKFRAGSGGSCQPLSVQ